LSVRFSIVFGQTEASPVITQTRLDDTPEDKAETIGQPLPQTEVKIVDAGGALVPTGEVGELCTRGYLVMKGYHEMPDATAAAIDADGWLHTGDLCSMDERGYCRVEGRLKDMIIRGGENIYPREIEDVLLGHPDVADVSVVGVPDAEMGEQVAAFVRPAAGATPDPGRLAAFCRERLAAYKTPGSGSWSRTSRRRRPGRSRSSCSASATSPRRARPAARRAGPSAGTVPSLGPWGSAFTTRTCSPCRRTRARWTRRAATTTWPTCGRSPRRCAPSARTRRWPACSTTSSRTPTTTPIRPAATTSTG
jgi:hypothetical protein